MRSLLTLSLASDKLWEFSFALIGIYLLFFPCWTYPQSYAVALGGGLVLLLFRPIGPETTQVLGRPWLLFLAYLLASSVWSVSLGSTLQSAGLAFLATLFYSMAKANSLEAQGRVEKIGLLLAFVSSLLAVYQWLYGFEHLRPLLPQVTGEEHEILSAAIYNRRASGPLATHGALAAFLILFIPQGFVLWKTQIGFKKRLFGVLTLMMAAGLLATQSVGGCLCLTLAALAVLLKRRSKTAVAMAALAGVAGILTLVWARGLQSWLLAALGTRLILWKSALSLFASHPFLGTGLGTFDEAYQQSGLPLTIGARFPHNLFLQVLVETGIVGFVLFLFVLADVLRRLKVPARWEGWGVGTGVLAFLLFSLLDLPFQMPEIVWFFAVVAARLELKPTQVGFSFKIPIQCLEYGLLIVFLISGFWPPFRPWNFALLACALWIIAALFQSKFEKIPFWIFVGAFFMALRAFLSPSAMGAVWFFEIVGILLTFYLVLPRLEKPKRFLMMFFGLGLVWAVKVWWASFHYAAPGITPWIHFQYSDVKDWLIFPNPKQVGLFLMPLVFFLWKKPRNGATTFGAFISVLTMLRLKSSGALLGLGAGVISLRKAKNRVWAGAAAVTLILGVLTLRFLDPSATKWERFQIWGSALKVWEQSPVLGVGPGAFAGYFNQVKFPRASGPSRYLMDAQYAHNEFLELLTAFGLVGFVFGLALLARAWRQVQEPTHRAGIAGLAAASFVDFCLHTPLIALQGTGLLAGGEPRRMVLSPIGGFLVLGLAAGLFVSPVFSQQLKSQAEADLAQNQFLPEDLRGLETAERLNAWDAGLAEARADYLEKLFLATKDPHWSRRSDEAFEKVLALEKTDGMQRLKKAERLTERLAVDASAPAMLRATLAWDATHTVLPYSAFARFEEGQFWLQRGDKEGALSEWKNAVFLEPNYAAAWVKLGLLLREQKEEGLARECFQKALVVYNQWKDADRIDPFEKQMVSLPSPVVQFLVKETSR